MDTGTSEQILMGHFLLDFVHLPYSPALAPGDFYLFPQVTVQGSFWKRDIQK